MLFINHIEVLDGKVAVVEIEGPLDNETSPYLGDYINTILDKNIIFILLDGRKLEFVSSAGIGVMLYIQQKISSRNGFMVIFNLSREIGALYGLLGFDKVFRISSGRSEAMEIMDRQIEIRGDDETWQPNPASEFDREEISEIIPQVEPSGARDESAVNAVMEHDHQNTFRPFIMECSNCKSLVRVKEKGEYLCPDCGENFSIFEDDDGSMNGGSTFKIERRVAFEPFVAECDKCKSLVRIAESGDYLCPHCETSFFVSNDQKLTF